jgi:Predicted enzyme related to lactoylglutathione lyase
MGNPFVHVELNTSDVDKAKKFYGQLFAWKFEDVAMGPSGHYTMIKPGEGTGGGILKHPMPGEPSTWLAYVGGGRGRRDREGEEARGQDRTGRDRGAGNGVG